MIKSIKECSLPSSFASRSSTSEILSSLRFSSSSRMDGAGDWFSLRSLWSPVLPWSSPPDFDRFSTGLWPFDEPFRITNQMKRFYLFCSFRTFFLHIQIFCIFLLLWLKHAYGLTIVWCVLSGFLFIDLVSIINSFFSQSNMKTRSFSIKIKVYSIPIQFV